MPLYKQCLLVSPLAATIKWDVRGQGPYFLVEEQMQGMAAQTEKHLRDRKLIKAKLDYLEGRNYVRIRGVSEGTEQGKSLEFIPKLLIEISA